MAIKTTAPLAAKTNGTPAPVKQLPAPETPTSKAEQRLPEQTPLKPAEVQLPPLDDRLHRLNQLFALQQKYNKWQEALVKLNDFEIKKDGERSHINIQDDSRNSFSTYHPEIIQEVVEFMKVRIKEKIKVIEPQLKW